MEEGGLETGRCLFVFCETATERHALINALTIACEPRTTEYPRDQQLILSMPELLLGTLRELTEIILRLPVIRVTDVYLLGRLQVHCCAIGVRRDRGGSKLCGYRGERLRAATLCGS